MEGWFFWSPGLIRAQSETQRAQNTGCMIVVRTSGRRRVHSRRCMMETIHDEEWRRLHERLRGIAKRRAALDAEEARCLREAHDMKLWRRLGYAHMNEYLERELGYAPQVGIERLRIAYALAELPRIEASLADGHLAYSAVRELTRLATADSEQAWLDKIRGKNLRVNEGRVCGRKRGDR